ncbi:hypothetical protein ASD50_18520, partial [Mesorhizobium sp. Root552]|uniref:hypothetical protein n=1 Tax=Mesorhizobium sp. Root552 TaxID=1736555 RepID=UPI0006FD6B2B
MKTSIDLLVEQLPDDARWWVQYLSIGARVEIDVFIRRGPRQTYFVVLRWISMRLQRLSMPNCEKA